MTNTAAAFLVRFTKVNRADQVVTVEKAFKSDTARTAWLDKNDADVVQVLAFSDPR